MRPDKEKLILIGGGGHCKSVIDVIESAGKYEIDGIVDVKEKTGMMLMGYKFIGADEDLEELAKVHKNYCITIGQIKSNAARVKIYNTLKKLHVNLPVIISNRAYVSAHSEIGESSIVMHDTIINTSSRVGINCIINTGALIEHDCITGDHCHISTNATLNGGAKVGNNVFVGSNVVINQGIEIADDVILGSGTIAIKNLTEAGIYGGNPAKKLN